MLFEFWGYLPYLFLKIWHIFFKIIKGIWDTGTTPLFQGLTVCRCPTKRTLGLYVYGFIQYDYQRTVQFDITG